jgi:hypothetical protein
MSDEKKTTPELPPPAVVRAARPTKPRSWGIEPGSLRGARGNMLEAPVDPHQAVRDAIKNLSGKEWRDWIRKHQAEFDAYRAMKTGK